MRRASSGETRSSGERLRALCFYPENMSAQRAPGTVRSSCLGGKAWTQNSQKSAEGAEGAGPLHARAVGRWPTRWPWLDRAGEGPFCVVCVARSAFCDLCVQLFNSNPPWRHPAGLLSRQTHVFMASSMPLRGYVPDKGKESGTLHVEEYW